MLPVDSHRCQHPINSHHTSAGQSTVKTDKFETLTEILGYRFNNPNLLKRALTHSSADAEHNEKLEFLGDSVLSMIVSVYLFENYPDATEGELSVKRSRIVNNNVALFTVADQIDFLDFIVVGKSFRNAGKKAQHNLLANTLEAVIGAIFLDGGYSAATDFFHLHFASILDQADEMNHLNFKSLLQEHLQSHAEQLPEYETIEAHGNVHEPEFTVACRVKGLQKPVFGRGMTVKQAEQIAAGRAYELLCGRSG